MTGHVMIGAAELSRLLRLDDDPTDEQAAVIAAPLTPAVVIAGAGSGKTETMASRVVWLIANRHVAPDAVLGLTFTRKAAAELGRRVRRRLAQWRGVVEREWPEDEAYLATLRSGEPTVSTYAAFAGHLVAEHAMRLGAEPDARLLSPAQAWQLADIAVREFGNPLPEGIGVPASLVRWVITMAGQSADHLLTVDDAERFCRDVQARVAEIATHGKLNKTGVVGEFVASLREREALLAVVADFLAAKRARNAVDFGDQMALAARLAALPEVQAATRGRFGAVLLDEYQDTGHAQVELLHALFGSGHPVTAVGDPFQSIYGWRGASAGTIERFAGRFRTAGAEPAAVYPLATSFRNDRAILTAANAVAEPLQGDSTLVLRPRPGAGAGRVALTRVETCEDEARWVAAEMSAAWQAAPPGARTAAVLVRRRSQIPLLAEALQAAGLPVEVVGLGGLLTTPEVSDVVATLRVIASADAAPALARLLTGARWRIGPRDLAALHRRARDLAEGQERVTLVEALDDLGPPPRYSPTGYARLHSFALQLRRLRRRVGAPLPELVAEVERVSGLAIEVAARADRAHVGRVHLDRFLDEATRFAAEASDTRGATLSAFLAFLDAAEAEENGLEAGEVEVAAERVQVLTVHGAKGLEWDVVAVPGLADGIFPAEPRGIDWTRTRQELPIPLRGDRADLPAFSLAGVPDPKVLAKELTRHREDLLERHAREERRLAYVALTRARSVLLASAYVWDTAVKPRPPSPYLTELSDRFGTQEWFEPEPDAPNPVIALARSGSWPSDPLGERRAPVAAAAAAVRAAPDPGGELTGRPGEWAGDVDLLLAERAAAAASDGSAVPLPGQLSVSQLVQLAADPGELARRLRRPVPQRPAPLARRGTRFHAWLEQRWDQQPLLDVDELPGAADAAPGADGADRADREFAALCEAFERSAWAERRPYAVEVPFEMPVGDVVLRGRMDAVFADGDGHWQVVDWKTGAAPADPAAASVQLASYRLAWARLAGVPDDELDRVRAAFHYVRSGTTVSPADLLDSEGLQGLLSTHSDT